MMNMLRCLVLILVLMYEINAFKILLVSPLPGKSHAILGDGIMENLAKAGHEVTYVTVFIPDKLPPNVTVVDLSDNLKKFPADDMLNLKAVMDKTIGGSNLVNFVPMMMNMTKQVLGHPNLQALMADKRQKFDVVIAEWLFSDVYAGFAAVFDCPLIWFSTVQPHWMVLKLIDEIPNPAYSVDTLSGNIPPLSFKQRFIELGYQIVGTIIQTFWISGLSDDLYETYFVPAIRDRHSFVPSLETLKYNASLMLSNSHVSMCNSVRLPPSFISIGGYHINPKTKPLPEDLQRLMDNAKHGVIYFSMGSNLRSKSFPDEVKQDLLEIFGKLKQTVLWKFEEDFPNKPNNVHILQWAPQQSILGHKNCVLFITHGGLLSTTESIHFGVPTIGIPVFADQFINVERSVKKGYAIKVDLSYTMAADLHVAIEEILSNPKYTARVKYLSQVYHDRPVPPAKELVHWVEHVVKTNGAPHLRSPALMVPWYQKLYLDLILVVIVIILALKYTFKFLKNKLLPQRKHKIN